MRIVTDVMNIKDREDRIRQILKAHYDWEPENPVQTAMDMWADLLHFIASHDGILQDTAERAYSHFTAERQEEGLPPYLHVYE